MSSAESGTTPDVFGTAGAMPSSAEDRGDLHALRVSLAALDPQLRTLAQRTSAALLDFERSVPDHPTVDYEAAFVATGAAAPYAALTDLGAALSESLAELRP